MLYFFCRRFVLNTKSSNNNFTFNIKRENILNIVCIGFFIDIIESILGSFEKVSQWHDKKKYYSRREKNLIVT